MITTLSLIALALEFAGTIMIAFTVLRVHERMLKELKIDGKVTREIRREQTVGYSGVALLTTGFLLNLIILIQPLL